MVSKIDYNRGVMIKNDTVTGINVYMYVDDPGKFLSVQGTEVSPELARSAGYDVEKLTKDRLLKKRMAEAYEKIREELAIAEEQRAVVETKEGFQIVSIGLGRHQVLAPDGEVLTKDPLPLEQAQMLLNQLVPDSEVKAVDVE